MDRPNDLAVQLRHEARLIEANNETKPSPSAYGRRIQNLCNAAADALDVAEPAVVVTDEMVERACHAFTRACSIGRKQEVIEKHAMRAALTAALMPTENSRS